MDHPRAFGGSCCRRGGKELFISICQGKLRPGGVRGTRGDSAGRLSPAWNPVCTPRAPPLNSMRDLG